MKHPTWLSSIAVALAACGGGTESGPPALQSTSEAAPPQAAQVVPAGPAEQLQKLYADYCEKAGYTPPARSGKSPKAAPR